MAANIRHGDGGARSGFAPGSTTLVTSIDSAPLAAEVDEMLNVSDDTAAELFTKELGYQASHSGSTGAGVTVIRQDLQTDGLPVSQLVQVDGSGLDRGDRASCNLLVQALRRSGPTGTIARGLPVAGKNGTLADRMIGTPAQGRLIAKTGNLDNVVSLSGFVLPPPGAPETPALGQPLVFSLLLNGPPDPVAEEVAGAADVVVLLSRARGTAVVAYVDRQVVAPGRLAGDVRVRHEILTAPADAGADPEPVLDLGPASAVVGGVRRSGQEECCHAA